MITANITLVRCKIENLKLWTPSPSYAAQPMQLGDINPHEESMLSNKIRLAITTFNGLVVRELSELGHI